MVHIFQVAASLLLLTVAAGFTTPNRASGRSGIIGSGSLYDDDIDWDSDLFGQINQREQAQPGNTSSEDGGLEAPKVDDGSWSMDVSTPSNIKDAREQMRQSWTGEASKQDETQSEKNQKLKVDWVPNFKQVDEDEPWFTG